MSKNKVSSSDIFVQKLLEKKGQLLSREGLFDIWLRSGGAKARFAYGLGQVKNRGVIEVIGAGIYRILSYPSSLISEREGIGIDPSYWHIILMLIHRYSPSGGIIAHEKSMEYHLRNYEIPKRIVIYTRDTDKRIEISGHEIHFRTLKSGEKSGMKNMYRILHDSSMEGNIDGVRLRFLSLEASLLDVASLRIHESGIAESLILRFLMKYEKKLSREALGELVKYRYIRAINRIRTLTKEHGYLDLYEKSLDIIRKEGGGCYLHL